LTIDETNVRKVQDVLRRIRPLDFSLADRVQVRLDDLTKPRGSLGRLEEVALRCALITGQEHPQVCEKTLFVCCADHGVCEEGVSAYPREVTAQMVYNYLRGGAAVSVLARQYAITVRVVDLGVDYKFPANLPSLLQKKVGRGTANFVKGPAMPSAVAVQAMEIGIELVTAEVGAGAQLLGIGEMGIGNTTVATALLAALGDFDPEVLTGVGTGIDEQTRRKKVDIVRRALARNYPRAADPLGCLARLGGYEIAGMVGICLAGAAWRVPVVIDGFIATAAAWTAYALCPAAKDYFIFAHLSAERGHARVLEMLRVRPLLNLEMCLGEGTGAVLGMNLVDSSVRLLNEMATFAEAGVSGKIESLGDRVIGSLVQ
jgi:nicotinate-nucleotide--dimethylbenzimidazole phosphoribosyltransferase